MNKIKPLLLRGAFHKIMCGSLLLVTLYHKNVLLSMILILALLLLFIYGKPKVKKKDEIK